LKDAASQELLVAVASERQLRTCNVSLTGFRTLQNFHEDFDAEEEASYSDDSDFDERVMQKLAFAASRARYVQRSEQHRSSGHCPSQFLLFTSSSNVHEEQQLHLTSPGEGPRLSHGSSDGDGLPSLSPPKSSPSETFSESMKSRWSAASSRCKESFTKGTRGLKEKLLARNDSVKELSKGVQREMSAGVTRMIEKLDLSSKQTEASVPLSGLGTSNFFLKGKAVQENTIVHSVNISNEEIAYDLQSSDTPSFVSDAMHTKLEASHAK
jgi:E3 ubiquitin-protein ligase RHF